MNLLARKISLFLIFLVSSSFLWKGNAQVTHGSTRETVSGIVCEQTADSMVYPLLQATVKLLHLPDSSLAGGNVTDLNGRFLLKQLKWGNYLLDVSYIGYEPVRKAIRLSADRPNCRMDTIFMSESSLALQEVVITGKAAEMVVKEDTVEFNPAAYTNKPSDVVEDLLKKLPGVEISEDGTITYGGKTIQRILIDGKDFFADSPELVTKNIPIEIIKRLQIVEEQSDAAKKTGIEDAEKETVINITVKEEKKRGWFGEARGGYGTHDRYHARGMVNRFIGDDKYTIVGGSNNRGGGQNRIVTTHDAGNNIIKEFGEKWKLQGNVSFRRSQTESGQKSRRENFLQDSSYFNNSENNSVSYATRANVRYKVEYEPDTSNFFVFRPTFSYNDNRSTSHQVTETQDGNLSMVNNGLSDNRNRNRQFGGGLRAEYIHRFKKQGRSIGGNVNAELEKGKQHGSNHSEYRFSRPDEADSLSLLDQWIDGGSDRQNFQASFFYNEPLFGKRNYLQFRYSFRLLKNNSFKETFTPDGAGNYTELDSAYSKGNRNVFMNHAFNLTYQVIRDKYRYSIGFQGERASTQSRSYVRDRMLSELPRQKVFNMSPNIDFRYRFSKYKELRVRYRGDMDQPSAEQLLPVEDLSDPLHIRVGNPDLLPSFEHDISLRYNSSSTETQRTIYAWLEYEMTKNSIVSISEVDPETAVRTSSYTNVNGVWNINGRFTFTMPFKDKRFQLNSYSYFRYAHDVGFTNALRNVSQTTTANETLSLRFRMDNLFEVGTRLSGRYVNNRNSIQTRNNKQTFDYTGTLYATVFLPLGFTCSTNLDYTGNSGYASGFEKDEWVWNAEIEKTFLKDENASISLEWFDILQEKTAIYRNISSDYIEDGEREAITSYALLTFRYKFNSFGKK